MHISGKASIISQEIITIHHHYFAPSLDSVFIIAFNVLSVKVISYLYSIIAFRRMHNFSQNLYNCEQLDQFSHNIALYSLKIVIQHLIQAY